MKAHFLINIEAKGYWYFSPSQWKKLNQNLITASQN